jgi:peptide/nickel transport system substrate-binding protein
MKASVLYTTFHSVLIVNREVWQSIMSRSFVGAESFDDQAGRLLDYKPAVSEMVGTGAFVPIRYDGSGSEQLVLIRNELFHGTGKRVAESPGSPKIHTVGPFVERIVINKFLDQDRMVNHLIEGKLHFIWLTLSTGHAEKLVEYPERVTVHRSPGNAFNFLFFNNRRPYFSGVPIRQALTYLIDKNDILQNIFLGQGSVMNSYIPPSNAKFLLQDVEDYGNASNMSRAERIANAVRILREAGYRWENEASLEGLIQPNGEPFPEIKLLSFVPEQSPNAIKIVTKLIDWWADVGITATYDALPFQQILERVNSHDFDFSLLGWSMNAGPPETLEIMFHSKNNRLRGTNLSGYESEEFDRLIDQFLYERDEETQIELAHKMQRVLVRDCPIIIINSRWERAGVSNRYEGWIYSPYGLWYSPSWSFLTARPARIAEDARAKALDSNP